MDSFWDYVSRTARKILGRTRRNHALEHGIVSILLKRAERPMHVLARATSGGFYVYADVTEQEVDSAAREALARIQTGEDHLSISPFCGTNLAIAGMLAALAAVFVLGKENRAGRLPAAMGAATLAVLVAQPLGGLAQRHVTTSSDVSDMRIVGVRRLGPASRPIFKVETAAGEAYRGAAYDRKAA